MDKFGGYQWNTFYDNGPQADSNDFDPAQPVLDEKSDQAPNTADPSMAYIFEHTRGKNV